MKTMLQLGSVSGDVKNRAAKSHDEGGVQKRACVWGEGGEEGRPGNVCEGEGEFKGY